MKKERLNDVQFWKRLGKSKHPLPKVQNVQIEDLEEYLLVDDYSDYSNVSDMSGAIENIMAQFSVTQDGFNGENAFQLIVEYYLLFDRILYSYITQVVIDSYRDTIASKPREEESDVADTMLMNIRLLLSNVSDDQNYDYYMRLTDSVKNNYRDNLTIEMTCEELLEKAKKALYKIYDFTVLAQIQWKKIRKINKEQESSIKRSVEENSNQSEKEMTKRLTSQLVTLVGIFTALAFLLFGGIDLGAKFISGGMAEAATSPIPVTKMLCIVALWGLALLNIVFVFLYCVGQMTDLDFKATKDETASFFQKYPVFIWSNYILLNVLVICGFLYFCFNNEGLKNPILEWTRANPEWSVTCIKLYIPILLGITLIFRYKTKSYPEGRKTYRQRLGEYLLSDKTTFMKQKETQAKED